MLKTSLAILGLLAALPAVAQDQGGIGMPNPYATLDKIEANQGCAMSSTSVTVGVNKATAGRSSAQQQLGTVGGVGPSGCRPLVSTRVVAGVNLTLGRNSNAGQTITAAGPGGVLATDTYTRGYNLGYGANSTATQRLYNQTNR